MPRGFGRGFWSYGFGRGMGNPYPYCRNFPWLPRRWWMGMYGPITPGGYPAYYNHFYSPYSYQYPYLYRW